MLRLLLLDLWKQLNLVLGLEILLLLSHHVLVHLVLARHRLHHEVLVVDVLLSELAHLKLHMGSVVANWLKLVAAIGVRWELVVGHLLELRDRVLIDVV